MTIKFNAFLGAYQPKSPAEKKFVEKHTIELHELPGEGSEEYKRNKANTTGTYEGTPHVVNALSTYVYNRSEHRQGYNPGGDASAYLSDPTAKGVMPNEDLQTEIDKILGETTEEYIPEHLSPSMGVHKYIDDFVHSSNSRFVGKSKEDRIKQALAAFYAAKKRHGMNEDVIEENINQKHARQTKKAKELTMQVKEETATQMFLEAVQVPLNEWSFNLNPAKKGMFKGKSLSDIKSDLAKLKKSGPHPRGSAASTKEHEDVFAINAKEHKFKH